MIVQRRKRIGYQSIVWYIRAFKCISHILGGRHTVNLLIAIVTFNLMYLMNWVLHHVQYFWGSPCGDIIVRDITVSEFELWSRYYVDIRTNTCRRWYCVLIFNFHFVVVYLICFYMWLRVLTSRKVTIYSDGDNIIIIIIVGFFLV